MNGKRYFPNNWRKYKDAPDEWFEPVLFSDVMTLKIGAWELPRSISCMIRVTNTDTKKTKEYVYQRLSAARTRVDKLMQQDDIEFTVCTPETISFVSTNEHIEDYAEEDSDESEDS